jgi:phosphoglycerate dehydrogenase-like enzyme
MFNLDAGGACLAEPKTGFTVLVKGSSMLTCEDYKDMANRVARLAIACSAPSVAEALMALALDHARRAAELSEQGTASESQGRRPRDPSAGYGD